MIKRVVYLPTTDRHKVYERRIVRLTAKRITQLEAYAFMHGCSFSAAYRVKQTQHHIQTHTVSNSFTNRLMCISQ